MPPAETSRLEFERPRPTSPKVADVVRAAGVSQALVYSFLSGRFNGKQPGSGVGISEETQERIVAACRQVGYEPADPELRNRVYPELGEYAFLLSSDVAEGISNAYFAPMMAGASAALTERQISYAPFSSTADYLICPELLPAPVRSGRVNRYLVGGPVNYSLIHAIQRRRGRVAYLSRAVDLPGIVSVVPDYARAADAAIRYLHGLGHRRIAVVAEAYFHSSAYNTRRLIDGVAAAMANVGLPFVESDILFKAVPGPEKPSSVMPKILERQPRPTAVFCFDDWTAKCMLQAATEAGVRVPMDLSVVGVNDDRTAAYLTPPLTTVSIPAFELGRRAVAELEQISAARADGQCIVLPVELIVRNSAAPPSA